MRILALSLVSASLLTLTACGGAETNNASGNTLETEALPPLDANLGDLGNTAADLNASGNGSLDVDTNVSGNASVGNGSVEANSVANSQ